MARRTALRVARTADRVARSRGLKSAEYLACRDYPLDCVANNPLSTASRRHIVDTMKIESFSLLQSRIVRRNFENGLSK